MSSAPPIVAADGPVIIGEPSPTMLGAGVRGEVVLGDGCVRLRSEFDGTTLILVWPAGTRWDADHQEVVLTNGARIPLGTSIDAGGGYFSAARAAEQVPTIRNRLIACLPEGATHTPATKSSCRPSGVPVPDETVTATCFQQQCRRITGSNSDGVLRSGCCPPGP